MIFKNAIYVHICLYIVNIKWKKLTSETYPRNTMNFVSPLPPVRDFVVRIFFFFYDLLPYR